MSVQLYSIDQVLSQFGGDKRFVKELLELFIEVTPEIAADLRIAVQEKDAERIGQLAHKIKPSLQILQVRDASSLAAEVEVSVNENRLDYSKVNELVKLIEQCVVQIKKDL